MSSLDGNASGKNTAFRGPQTGGSVFDNYSWMSEPELVFGKQESQRVLEAVEVCQMERVHHGTGAEHIPEEPAKSDPSSIDSSQEEDSLERISPDSPFEVLVEMQEKGPCAEDTSKSLSIVDKRRVDLNLPQKPPLFTAGIETDPLGQTMARTEADTVAAIGPKSNLKIGDLPHTVPCPRAGVQQEIPDGQSSIAEGDVFRPNAITGGGISMDIISKSFQPSVCGSMSRPQDLIPGDPLSQLPNERKMVCGLEMDLALSFKMLKPVSGPGTDGLSPYSLIKITPDEPVNPSVQVPTSTSAGIKTLPDVGHEGQIDPLNRSSDPSAEVPPKDPMDEPQPLKKEAKEISPGEETRQLREDPASTWGSSQCPALEGTTALDHVLSMRLENVEADSSGESDDTVIEDVRSIPVGTPWCGNEQSGDTGTTEKLVFVPLLNLTESREQAVSDRQRESVNLQSTSPGGDRTLSAETRGCPAESPVLVGTSPGLGHAGEVVSEQRPIPSQEVVSSVRAVSPSLPLATSYQLDEHMSTVEDTGKREPRSGSPVLPTLSHVDQLHWHPHGLSPTDSPTTQRSADFPVFSADSREHSVVEGSSPLQEMIRRSAAQRGHIFGELQSVSVKPASPQSIIVKSTPIVTETPTFVVRSANGPAKAEEGVAEGTLKVSDSASASSVGLAGVQQPAVKQEVANLSASGRRDTQNDQTAKDGQSCMGSDDTAQPQLTTAPQALSKLTLQQYSPNKEPERDEGLTPHLAQPLVDTAPPSDSKVRPELKSQTVSDPVQMERPVGGEASDRLSKMAVKNLIYWRDPKKTGVVFGSILTLLVSLAVFSVVSVLAYLVLALLSVTISFRIYKSVVQAVQKTNDGNPFKPYLEQDITLSSETFHKYCNIAFTHLNRVLKYLLQLFLVQDLVDSLKLAVLMWLMTYVGAVFNGLTLLILAILLTFSIPVIYQAYQTQIDHYFELVQKQATCAFGKIQEKLPGAKRKSE
ncbi:reticulon-1-like [Stegostoma tigrinum]|uniref:reticulon-1-like n=1 Tax=Stegostoma tigrinum TaxID=3053191 RepID=UPI00287014D0|nr:reticulon-1-like [Stegostoma tigrinum]